MEIKIKKLHPNAKLPTYATDGSGCFDLYAATVDGMAHIGSNIWPSIPVSFGTGLAFEIPAGHVMLVFSRSGHGFKHDVRLANCVGVIDADYRGEVAVKLTCDDQMIDGDPDATPMFVKPGDRIAQALIIPFPRVTFVEADALSSTERGAGGFGSTGQ